MRHERERKARRSWTGLLVPALLAFVVLIGLGTWQLQRKAWKEGLIATLNAHFVIYQDEPPTRPPQLAARRLEAQQLFTVSSRPKVDPV